MYIVDGNYLCVFSPMKKLLYGVNVYVFISMAPFLWLKIVKMGFLFSVNVYVFIPMVIFYRSKTLKMRFLFSVNVYVFIHMMLFYG